MDSALLLSFREGGGATIFARYLTSLTWLVTQFSLLSGGYQTKSLQSLWHTVLFSNEALHAAAFTAEGLLTFFTSYEGVLIPLQLLISHWGSGIKRLRASVLFFVYTYAGSVPIMLAVFYLASLTEALVLARAATFFVASSSCLTLLSL